MDIAGKIQRLLDELHLKADRELRLARWSHWLNISAMALTLISTAEAVIYGLFPGHSSQITAGLALVPGGISLLATSLKLESRCDWHYRRYYSLTGLIRSLEIELPDNPTQDQVSAISMAFSKIELDSESSWEKELSLDWKRFQKTGN